MIKLNASNLNFDTLNETVRKAKEDIEISDCLGQRFIGAGLSDKNLTIKGTPGNALGAYLNGSTISVFGNAQDAVGDTMNDGKIIVNGNIGDCAGYAMRGGRIFVKGNAGYRAGIHMKAYKEKKPLMVVGGGLLQVLVLNKETPVFCFACAILMIIFYINALEAKISTDPLTGLNNRGQLLNYTTQKSNLQREGRQTVVVMFDINDFKSINDTYGHAEGDRALKFVADSMRAACRTCNMPLFLARYGGDEFIIIAHPTDTGDIAPMIENIREQLRSKCRAVGAPYVLEIGAGHSQLEGGSDTFQLCLQRADENLYLDKTLQKSRRPAAAHR